MTSEEITEFKQGLEAIRTVGEDIDASLVAAHKLLAQADALLAALINYTDARTKTNQS